MDTLNAAGYEAYNVTSTNYEALESQLNTDFADMGLVSDGSYIITIHDENYDNNIANGVNPDVTIDQPDEDSGGNGTFTYTYNGTTYTMRYMTVASTGTYMQDQGDYKLTPSDWWGDATTSFLPNLFVTATDHATKKFHLGTIASFLLDLMGSSNYTRLQPNTLTIISQTNWDCDILQIWDDYSSQWKSAQVSARAISTSYSTGLIYDPDIRKHITYVGDSYVLQTTSPKYTNYSQRKLDAVSAYTRGAKSYDPTGDIEFYLGNEEGEIVYTSGNSPIFTHSEEWWSYIYYY